MNSTNESSAHMVSEYRSTEALPAPPAAPPAAAELPDVTPPAKGAALVVTRGPLTGARFELATTGSTSVGRHQDSDIVLDDATVSRQHAHIRFEDGQFLLIDSGSLNGTYVNRRPVDRSVLGDGDEIWVGKFRCTFLDGTGS